VNQLLGSTELDSAIKLGERTLEKHKNNRGKKYDNTLNSHVKGRLGEFALEKWLADHKIVATSHFQDDGSEGLCDIEVPAAKVFKRVEIKTWSKEFWKDWGRCIAVTQIGKIQTATDAILWCRVNLPKVTSVEQLRSLGNVEVEFVGYSTPSDAAAAPIRATGPFGRQVVNHQLEDTDLRPTEELLADLAS
jgi:hypothetical protein